MADPRPPAPAAGLLAGYDVVAFDCDGVLLDSNHFKIDAFREVLTAHDYPPDEVDRFCTFQAANFGTSRYRLFELLLEGRFGPPRGLPIDRLLADFGEACRAGYLRQEETPGLRAAILRAGAGRPLYVVSGSDEAELAAVLDGLGLAAGFAAIFGSPRTKVENLARLRGHRAAHGGTAQERLLFVGDAFADMHAAEQAGADFVFMAGYSTVRAALEPAARSGGWPVIEDLRELV